MQLALSARTRTVPPASSTSIASSLTTLSCSSVYGCSGSVMSRMCCNGQRGSGLGRAAGRRRRQRRRQRTGAPRNETQRLRSVTSRTSNTSSESMGSRSSSPSPRRRGRCGQGVHSGAGSWKSSSWKSDQGCQCTVQAPYSRPAHHSPPSRLALVHHGRRIDQLSHRRRKNDRWQSRTSEARNGMSLTTVAAATRHALLQPPPRVCAVSPAPSSKFCQCAMPCSTCRSKSGGRITRLPQEHHAPAHGLPLPVACCRAAAAAVGSRGAIQCRHGRARRGGARWIPSSSASG